MELIDRVAQELARFPSIRPRREGGRIEVPAAGPEGFEVSLFSAGRRHIVHYDRWHEDFAEAEEAMACFMAGLTAAVRLKVTKRGECAHLWTVEVREGDGWKAAGTVGQVFFPFWRRKEIVTLQNRWIDGPPPGVKQS